MKLPNITLIDLDQLLVEVWQSEFKDCASVEVVRGDYFEIEADAMVSPANSFGSMDGGLDAVITYELGATVQDNLQKEILDQYYGELPVGCALVVETGNDKWPYLVSAPTMRVPEDVSNTVNAYLAFRATLLAVMDHNEKYPKSKISSLVCSGLGTGVGEMKPLNCARQMRMAYDVCLCEPMIPSLQNAHINHYKMKSKV